MNASRKFDGFVETMAEASDLDEVTFNKMVEDGTFEEFDTRMNNALERDVYWTKWRNMGNTAIDRIDGDIAALKQQALAGGC